MLSDKEKKEMLEDARSARRRKDFEYNRVVKDRISIDEHIAFLDDVQKIFSPFKISVHHTVTKLNKL